MSTGTYSSSSGPSPNSLVAWIERDTQGNLWVYTLSSTGTRSAGQRLMLRKELREGLLIKREDLQEDPPCPNGIWTGFCWLCP
jgi:hypothetical protein